MGIRVLVVDDSAFMRQIITKMLEADPQIQVVGSAIDGLDAIKKVKTLNPDVVTLDLEMPRMDGLECLKRIMTENPCPVVIVSSLAKEGAEPTLKALEGGAVDFVTKPSAGPSDALWDMECQLAAKVKMAFGVPVHLVQEQINPEVPLKEFSGPNKHSYPLILGIGASTGGPRALQTVLGALPADFPVGVVVAQHMPKDFTRVFAQRLNATCPMKVKEAKSGDKIEPGLVLVAPSGFQTEIVAKDGCFKVKVSEQAQIYRPCVDVLFNSMVATSGARTMAVLLTGMGADGAKGLKALRDIGAHTIAEAEETCVVYGMPRVAWEMGGAEFSLPLTQIPEKILRLLEEGNSSD